jgi:glycosyltransferase involved in cell wall biosynthesis
VGGGLLIAGNDGGTNVGASLLRAAHALRMSATLCDAGRAYAGSRAAARVNWWLRGRRPTRLAGYGREIAQACREQRPAWLIATGVAPIERGHLDEMRAQGVVTINYLTDDPWNPAFKSRWFLEALPAYDRVYSPRTRNLDELKQHGCRRVEYLPFAVDPDLFFPEALTDAERARHESDVCFVGGAEPARVAIVSRLMQAGINVALYGDYWDRHVATRPAGRGHVSAKIVRKATSAAAISLCLVRHANRDGHTMRTFEAAAMGGCLLVEDTDEHRRLLGDEDATVSYFRSEADVVDRAQALLRNPERRQRLAAAARQLIACGRHTYRDRLHAMLGVPESRA